MKIEKRIIFFSACPDLPPPTGGALACSTALGNEICTMSCSDKYQVAKGTSIEYVCNNEQIWLQGIPPNCTGMYTFFEIFFECLSEHLI